MQNKPQSSTPSESKELLRKIVFLPLSKLYGFGTSFRNKLFDWGIKKETEFKIPIIVVGNLSVGGTGKTPHVEHIVNILRENYNVGILSRGYKRETKGFIAATPHSTPRDIGDEAYQMYHKFGRKIMVAVCEKRVLGIQKMMEINPQLNMLVLDDAFQHRYVKPKVSILLTEFQKPYYEDHILPYGRLRESTKNASRADIVIVTKCPPSLTPLDYRIKKKYLDLIPDQDLFFTRLQYELPRPVFPSAIKANRILNLDTLRPEDHILIVCGIGNPKPFVRFIKSFGTQTLINVFADHHEFTRKDMETLQSRFETMPTGRRYVVTTEKDAVRLVNNPYFPHKLKPYIYFIPVHIAVDEIDNADFERSLMKFINL